MRIKRCIALIVLTIYLFAVGAPVYAALTCRCAAMQELVEHRCCSHCNHDDSVTKGRVHFEAPCCGDQHSTDIELYTSSFQDGERYAKRLATIELPPAILAEALVSVDCPCLFCGRVVDQPILSVFDSHISSCGLRAPPVLA